MGPGHARVGSCGEPVLPAEFRRVVELGLTRLEPWAVLEDERERRELAQFLARRLPEVPLLPFARRTGTGLVAAWRGAGDLGPVVVLDATAADGWEARTELVDFHAWLREAVEDLILDFW